MEEAKRSAVFSSLISHKLMKESQYEKPYSPSSPSRLKFSKEVITMDAAIQKAERKLEHVSGDKEALRAYHMRELALSDWTSGINHARREGKLEGKLEEKLELASKLKRRGVPVDQIAEDTGLSAGEIAKL
jgi:predicted transposase/invertase (TIGR01784 family)